MSKAWLKEVRECQCLTGRSRGIGKLLEQIMRQVSTAPGAQKEKKLANLGAYLRQSDRRERSQITRCIDPPGSPVPWCDAMDLSLSKAVNIGDWYP